MQMYRSPKAIPFQWLVICDVTIDTCIMDAMDAVLGSPRPAGQPSSCGDFHDQVQMCAQALVNVCEKRRSVTCPMLAACSIVAMAECVISLRSLSSYGQARRTVKVDIRHIDSVEHELHVSFKDDRPTFLLLMAFVAMSAEWPHVAPFTRQAAISKLLKALSKGGAHVLSTFYRLFH